MKFSNRIKKEMTEGIVRALLEDAGYRVIDSGIEKVLRELNCLTPEAYKALGYPGAMRNLPDFTVMDAEQTEKHLVEVKYRTLWTKEIFQEIREQVKALEAVTLICVNAAPPASNRGIPESPARYIRCCRLKFENGRYLIEIPKYTDAHSWVNGDALEEDGNLWWRLKTLQDQFPKVRERKNDNSLLNAVQALKGILDA